MIPQSQHTGSTLEIMLVKAPMENVLDFTNNEELRKMHINVYEPFAKFLLGTPEEYEFKISILDVVKFAGHACPSMIGAFLIAKTAVAELFPETKTCVRGLVRVEIANGIDQGPTGPMANVFSMIFGSWEKSGFPGLNGNFVRKDLLRYNVPNVPQGHFRFQNTETLKIIDILYDHSRVQIPYTTAGLPFQILWRHKIKTILQNPEQTLFVTHLN